MKPDPARRYAPWFWTLTTLFALRVAAQPAALVVDAPLLPGFERWHSGAIPYPALVVTQLLILVWMLRTASHFHQGRVVPRRRLGLAMLVFGDLYFTSMLLRLVLGATVLSERRWFASPLPTFFHLVLATYVALYGWYHLRHGVEGVS
jgi:hypothetical protein